MTNRTRLKLTIGLGFTLAGILGCSDGYAPTRQAEGQEIQSHGLDVQDVEEMATTLAESLLRSGQFSLDGEKPIIKVSQFVNNTSQIHIDRDRITTRILMTLVNGGMAYAYAEGQEADTQRFLDGENTAHMYDIQAKIYEDNVTQGRRRQVSYVFQMRLNDLDKNVTVWIEEQRITTESKRSSTGY